MKRICSLFLTLALVLGLCACGQKAPTWEEQYDLGVKYLSEGNYQEAIIAFTAAIEIDPKRAEAYVGRGDAYIGSGETAENLAAALADYEQAAALDETNPAAYLGMADVYIRMGEYDKALEILRQGLDKTGNDERIAEKIAEMESGTITDASGKVRRTSGYDESGALKWYWDHTYDAQGREATVTAYDASGSQMGFVELAYDEQGNPLRDYHYDSLSGEIGVVENTYDEAGNCTGKVWYMLDGTVLHRVSYTYENGLVVREDVYDSDGALRDYWLDEYDGQGNRTKRSNYDTDGSLNGYQTWEYNEDGHVSVYTDYDENGERSWYTVYLYDEQGNYLGHEEYDGDGTLAETIMQNG